MTDPTYATREQIMRAFDVRTSASMADQVDRAAQTASRSIERMLHRQFYPSTRAKTYGIPGRALDMRGSMLWLEDDLWSLTSVTLDGVTVTGAVPLPYEWGPPYDRVSFVDADAQTGEIAVITGRWGYSAATAAAGTLAAAITTTTQTGWTVSDGAQAGVGDLLFVDSEAVVVTGRALTGTGTTISGNLTVSNAETSVPVGSGAAVHAGETVTVDSERMLVVDISGNTLVVRRAVDGSVLAAHTSGAAVNAPRLLTVERGAAGTTAATHSNSAPVTRNVPPSLVGQLCVAETQALLGQEASGWNQTVGDGESARMASGAQVAALAARVDGLYRRGRYGRAV